MQRRNNRNIFLGISFLLICFLSCRKTAEPVPYASVNLDVYITDPAYVSLNAIGGWVYVTGGVRGLILYRKSNDEFLAFERNCTYRPSDNCALVKVESSNVSMADSCCGSRFQIMDGAVLNGPASLPLKQYQTTFNGTLVHVYN